MRSGAVWSVPRLRDTGSCGLRGAAAHRRARLNTGIVLRGAWQPGGTCRHGSEQRGSRQHVGMGTVRDWAALVSLPVGHHALSTLSLNAVPHARTRALTHDPDNRGSCWDFRGRPRHGRRVGVAQVLQQRGHDVVAMQVEYNRACDTHDAAMPVPSHTVQQLLTCERGCGRSAAACKVSVRVGGCIGSRVSCCGACVRSVLYPGYTILHIVQPLSDSVLYCLLRVGSPRMDPTLPGTADDALSGVVPSTFECIDPVCS